MIDMYTLQNKRQQAKYAGHLSTTTHFLKLYEMTGIGLFFTILGITGSHFMCCKMKCRV